MAVLAIASVTLALQKDVASTWRYYLLQASTLSPPAAPTVFPPPSAWDDTEPGYTSGSTSSLYTVDCTVYSDGTFQYTPVSLSSSYEAAKAAYNKAGAAQTAADAAQADIDNLSIGGRNLMIGTLNPVVTPTINRPHFMDQEVATGVRGTAYVVEHGIGQRNTNTSYPYIRFGSSTYSTAGLYRLTPGETYTLSCDAKWKLYSAETGTGSHRMRAYLYADFETVGVFNLQNQHDIGDAINQDTRGTDMSGRCEFTFTLPEGITAFYVIFRPSTTTTGVFAVGDFIELHNLKLEKGNRATDWTPAPEDQNAANELLTELTTIENNTTVIDGGKILTGSIGADKIAANAITAGNIKLFGEMNVYQNNRSFEAANKGGSLGYMSGLHGFSDGTTETTNGMGIVSPNGDSYLIVTDSGVRMSNYTNSKRYDAYIADGYFRLSDDTELILPRSALHRVGKAYGNLQVLKPVYTNESPTATFFPMTLTDQDYLTNCNLLYIGFYPKGMASLTGMTSICCYVPDTTDTYLYLNGSLGYDGTIYMYNRRIRINRAEKKIQFYEGYQTYPGSTSVENGVCVPLYILAGNV